MNARALVNEMLENDQDEHVKAWDRIQKLNGAKDSFKELTVLQRKKNALYNEMGSAISLEHALAEIGVDRSEVASYITSQWGSLPTGVSMQLPGTRCVDKNCQEYNRPKLTKYDTCGECGAPLENTTVNVPLSTIARRYPGYMLGVRLKDGKMRWFKRPVPGKTHDWLAGAD